MSLPIADLEQRRTNEAAHARSVRAMFQRIAPTYDLLNRVLSAGFDQRWRRRAAEVVALAPPGPLLDVCAGTLDLAAELERCCPERRIHAVDFAPDMLARGRHKVRRVEIAVGDAMALALADHSFAGAVCGFGLRNLSSPQRGLAEMFRVLSPGGVLGLLEFFRPEPQGFLGAATRSVRGVVAGSVLPAAGRLVAKDAGAYGYLARSMASFLTRRETEAELARLGFVGVRGEDLAPFGMASLIVARVPS